MPALIHPSYIVDLSRDLPVEDFTVPALKVVKPDVHEARRYSKGVRLHSALLHQLNSFGSVLPAALRMPCACARPHFWSSRTCMRPGGTARGCACTSGMACLACVVMH